MKSFSKIWISISLVAIVLGIGLLLVNVIQGFTLKDIPTYSEDASFVEEEIKNISIDIHYGDLTITEGDEFHIKGENLPEDSLEVFVNEKGTWNIRQNSDYLVNVFGFHISLGDISWWEQNKNQKIDIAIPKDFIASEFNLTFGAGAAKIDKIQAKSGKLQIGAGELEIDSLDLEEKGDINVGAGKMIINDMNINNAIIDCGVGNIIMKGHLTGNNKISCGIGEIFMDLNGNIEDYALDIDKGIGNITINGRNYTSLSGVKSLSKEADNQIKLDCGIGSIVIHMD